MTGVPRYLRFESETGQVGRISGVVRIYDQIVWLVEIPDFAVLGVLARLAEELRLPRRRTIAWEGSS